MAVHQSRLCGACERECPSWANRCPACGSTAISYQLIIAPPSGTNIRTLADNASRPRRNRVLAPDTATKAPIAGCFG